MTPARRDAHRAVVFAVATSTMLVAFQMAAKATRDALFLSHFAVQALPVMVMGASLASLALAYGWSRLLPRFGPSRLLPVMLGASALLLLFEWVIVGAVGQLAAVLFYLHYAGFGALLISGFWSLITERFDPRAAKRYIGRIAAGATVGGLLGGILAERASIFLPVSGMLPVLATLQLVSAWMVVGIAPAPDSDRRVPEAGADAWPSGLRTLAETPYLRALVALVLLATVSEMFVDYVFKARAAESGANLLRLFAVFYTVVALFTLIVQAAFTKLSLQRLGLARSVAVMPAVTFLGSLGALVSPGLATAGLARGGEAVMRNSLYRSGYELFFTPIAARDKRATKALIDVGVVRLGDIAGGGLVQILLVIGAAAVNVFLLVGAVVLSLGAIVVSLRLGSGYVRTLERSLLSQAVRLDPEDVEDLTTRTALLQTVGALDLSAVAPLRERQSEPAQPAPVRPGTPAAATLADPEVERLVELRSRDGARIRRALSAGAMTPAAVAEMIPLLAWNDVARDVARALQPVAARFAGQLIDRLLDPEEDFAVRRRIPVVLALAPTERVADGLLRALEDQRFEVRYRSGHVLSRLRELDPDLAVERDRALAAVLREVAVDRGVWESRRLLDQLEDDDWSPIVDEVLRDRADRSLEHVFTLLSLILPREPLRVAFQALHTDDRMLRGTALEYLDSALPSGVRDALWPFLEDDQRRSRERTSGREVLDRLLRSQESIAMNLEQLRRTKRESDGGASGGPEG